MAFKLSPPPNDRDVQAVTWKQWFYKIIEALAQPTDLSDVTGVLAPEHGGTGSDTIPDIGAIPVGDGINYQPKVLTAGTNITIVDGASTITINATGGGSGKIYEPVAASGEILFSINGDVMMAWGGEYAS